MDVLPPELILEIVKYLPVKSVVTLAQISRHYTWLRQDVMLWKSLTARDLQYGLDRFASTPHPITVYQDLSTCHYDDDDEPMDQAARGKLCHQPIIPGIPYCRYHCREYEYEVCHHCRVNLVNLVDGQLIRPTPRHHFCHRCWKNRAYENGCKFIVEIEEPKHCGAQRVCGTDYCQDCLSYQESDKFYQSAHPPKQQHLLAYNGPPIAMIPIVYIFPYACDPRYSIIAEGPLIGTLIKKRGDGVIIAVSRFPLDMPLRWFREISDEFHHPPNNRRLTDAEKQLALMMGFWVVD
jgi:hypothetical protein